MKTQLLLAFLMMTVFFSCKDDDNTPAPDMISKLTVDIPLDGNAIDLVSNTTGTIHNAVPAPNRNGVSGKSMQFDPQDSSYIDFGDLAGASFTNNVFTISLWAVAIDTAGVRPLLSKRTPAGPFEYSLDSHFDHNFYNLDNWISSGASTVYGTDPLDASVHIAPGAWQHIAYVADGASLKVYVNGVLQSGTDTLVAGQSFSDTDAPFMIGTGGAFGVNHYFNGCVDDIKMYNRALTAKEVGFLMEL